ncbi:hypothetical protein M405DRAFT_829970, partial [Rhizopogon salebrosus TDB-379]
MSLASVKSLYPFHHHCHLSSVRLFIPCIEQPVTDCPPTLLARRAFQTLLNRRHATRQGKVRRVNETGKS